MWRTDSKQVNDQYAKVWTGAMREQNMGLPQYTAEVLKLPCTYESPGSLLKYSFLGPNHSGVGGPQATLWEHWYRQSGKSALGIDAQQGLKGEKKLPSNWWLEKERSRQIRAQRHVSVMGQKGYRMMGYFSEGPKPSRSRQRVLVLLLPGVSLRKILFH